MHQSTHIKNDTSNDMADDDFTIIKKQNLNMDEECEEREIREREMNERKIYDVSKVAYNKKLHRERKRVVKHLSKQSPNPNDNSSTGISSSYMAKSNFNIDIQDLRTKEDAQVVLDLSSVECAMLTLLQRAKLFVKLYYQESKSSRNKGIKNVKFKKGSNQIISEHTLPTKNQLIKILKEQLHMDYR